MFETIGAKSLYRVERKAITPDIHVALTIATIKLGMNSQALSGRLPKETKTVIGMIGNECRKTIMERSTVLDRYAQMGRDKDLINPSLPVKREFEDPSVPEKIDQRRIPQAK